MVNTSKLGCEYNGSFVLDESLYLYYLNIIYLVSSLWKVCTFILLNVTYLLENVGSCKYFLSHKPQATSHKPQATSHKPQHLYKIRCCTLTSLHMYNISRNCAYLLIGCWIVAWSSISYLS